MIFKRPTSALTALRARSCPCPKAPDARDPVCLRPALERRALERGESWLVELHRLGARDCRARSHAASRACTSMSAYSEAARISLKRQADLRPARHVAAMWGQRGLREDSTVEDEIKITLNGTRRSRSSCLTLFTM